MQVASRLNVWATDFEMPAYNFFSANAAQGKDKEREKVLLPAGVSKSLVLAPVKTLNRPILMSNKDFSLKSDRQDF
jgi:arsenate reductase-like glutaredoxin family protein